MKIQLASLYVVYSNKMNILAILAQVVGPPCYVCMGACLARVSSMQLVLAGSTERVWHGKVWS